MISKEEVKHIAKLARLGVSKKEEEKFQKDISSILDYFSSLSEVILTKTEPTFHSTAEFLLKENAMREDKEGIADVEMAQKLIALAPQKKDNYIKVKAVF